MRRTHSTLPRFASPHPLTALLVLFSVWACDVERTTEVDLQPTLSIGLAVIGGDVLSDVLDQADNLFVQVDLPNGEVVKRTVELTPGQNEIRTSIALPIQEDQATVSVLIELRQGTSPLFSGRASVVVRRGQENHVEMILELLPPAIGGQGSITAGEAHTCGIDGSGAGHCWGNNSQGQLGIGQSSPNGCGIEPPLDPCAMSPTPITGGLAFKALTAGDSHTCGLTEGGLAYCWGRGSLLGTSSAPDVCGDFDPNPCARAPQAVEGGFTFAAIDAGGDHTCALTPEGAAFCWGENTDGQLGDGTTASRTTPVAVAGGLTFMAIDAGGGHTCALTSSGSAYCWGFGEYIGVSSPPDDCAGEFEPGPCAMSPVAVEGGLVFERISGNSQHTCALTEDGAAYCWGDSEETGLGDGTQDPSPTPVAVAGGHTFVAITTGLSHSCALTQAGAAYCWGAGGDGELGTTPPDDCSNQLDLEPCALSPTPVSGGHEFVDIAGGLEGSHTCAITLAGEAYCWGDGDDGQLGDGTATDRARPVAVSGGVVFRVP